MKTRLTMLKFLIILCGAFVTTAAFAQTTYTWTGAPGDGTNLAVAVNWGGTLPNTATSDTGQWDGSVAGPLNLVYNNSAWQSGFGQSGVNLYLTGTQTSPVNLSTTPGSGRGPIAFQNITIDSGAGAFTFGGPNSANVINWIARPTGAIHTMINNSANTATLNPWIRYTAGGGATWTLDFSGTGNWQCNSYMNNDNGPGMLITADGPGTVFWNPTGFLGANGFNSPIAINGGKLVLQNPHPRLGNQAITLNGNFDFNMTNTAAAQTLSGVISGTGTNTVIAGTLTLSGQSTYTGDTILQGGQLTVAGAENPGVSGPLGLGQISFNGGTLGFSVNNVFDYSSRFSTAAGQVYNFDTGGQSVAFTNAGGLTSSGATLTKLGAGSLTLAGASTYSGLTTVSVGKLVFQGAKTGSGNITVADSAALGVYATGTQVTPGTLALGTGTALEFDNVNSIATAPLAPTTLTSAGSVTININSGALNPATSYPLLAWTTGTAPAVSLGVLNGFIGNLSTNGNSIQLNVIATAYKWSGANNSSWDLITANNWIQNGGPVTFINGGPALFDDTLTANESVSIAGVVQPTSITVNNVNTNYTITSSTGNFIGGSANLTKSGSGLLTLVGGANTNIGVTTASGGTLSVSALANGGSPSDIGAASSSAANLVLNGGTLQYTGAGVSIDRSFTVGTSGGTINSSGSGALSLTNTGALGYSGNGPRSLTLTGADANNNTLAAPVANNGGATAVTKSGAGKWVLTGANTYSGVTTIAGGVLQIGAGGGSGSLGSGNINIGNNSQLVFNRTNSLTVGGVISGAGAVTNEGSGTLILTGNNTFTGGTTISAGTVQLGNGGASGSLETASPIVNNGLLV